MASTTPSRRSVLALAGLTALSVSMTAACGAGEPGGGASANGKVTFDWWNIATTEPGKSLFPQISAAFTKTHPKIAINTTSLENEAFKSKLTATTSSGRLPDVYQTWGGGVLQQQVEAGLVEDLTDLLDWSSRLTPVSLQAYQFGGRTYGVPYDIGMVGFWYNKKLFAKAGITTPPATWAAFLDDVGKLKAAGITPIALAGKEKWPGHYYWAYLAMRVAGLPALQKAATTKDFTGDGFVQAGARLKELVDLQPFQPGFLGAGYATPGGQAATMGNGRAAMELMGQWGPSVQKDAGADLGADLGFFPFPTVDGGVGRATEVFGGGGGFALRKGAPKEALDFLKFFVLENESALLASNGYLPVVKGAESRLTDANRKVVAESLVKATGFQLFLDQAYPPAVGQEVNDSVADLLAGKKTPEQVTASITEAAKSA
ncbi:MULTISPECIES: extracellular solute-binding protein [unclassified Streptomyces]|uniref:extracellular solute-binding protein n=1 Tax=unclassified Streptomyces TaxID=2593676 RepID=UPI0006F9B0D2|nr:MULTISPECIES: extracellular solute-binding protein [unclassified Streptomyces]KQX49933.1 ABC transporter substrate-binding protein [Streptomyces sp. Root1304]KRA80024.1 ABC transporter substrate-binding protein [Streptomyces sp. Root66D1]